MTTSRIWLGAVCAALVLVAAAPPKKPMPVLPHFALWSTSGKTVSTEEYAQSKGLVLVFICNHCPMAKGYLPTLDTLSRLSAAAGYPMLAINPMDSLLYEEETRLGMQALAKSHALPYPYLQDAQQTITRQLAVAYTPEVYVLAKSPNGWALKYHGAIDNGEQAAKQSWVMQAITQLNKGQKLATPHRVSVGCEVFYRKKN